MDVDFDSPIIDKAKEFLEATKKYSGHLTEIIQSLEDDGTTYEATLALEMIFSECLKNRMMFSASSNEKDSKDTQISKHMSWLRSNYETTWNKLLSLLSDAKHSEQAIITLFRLLGLEGKYPMNQPKKGTYYFPHEKLEMILKTCFNLKSIGPGIQNGIDEYTNYIDITYYLWLLVPSVLPQSNTPSEKQASIILDMLKQVPVPSEEELQDFDSDVLLCFTKNKSKFKPKYAAIQESIQNLWTMISRWNETSSTHVKVLALLIENFMPHLSKPVLTMDYLMESLNAGGAVPLLALQGIFVLVKDHNLHLPEIMVASFIKRFARLCLEAPPHDILVLIAFIGNLLIRHSGLRKMIQHPTGGTVSSDPFLEYEQDPMNTKAIESSLWELETMRNHVLPKISSAVNFISKPLPNAEWDLTPLIEGTYEDIFAKESKNKFQKVSLTFEKPDSFVIPQTQFFSEYWSFDE